MAKFKHYTYATIHQKADGVRKKFTKDINGYPVDIEKIVEFGFKLDIRAIPNLKSNHDIEAFLSNDLTVIFIDQESYMNPSFASRMRFSLAHELGHLILHKDFYTQTKFTSTEDWVKILQALNEDELEWYERHANEFAGRLLVPVEALESQIKSLHDEIKKMETTAQGLGFNDPAEIQGWKMSAVAKKLASAFEVSSKTIEMRIKKEKIQLP